MQVKALIQDDDAVSPVIGVILMVAITVILAAVIASFVLGLGDTADEVQPTTSFSFDLDGDGDDATLEITLSDGDPIEYQEIAIRGSGVEGEVLFADLDWSGTGLDADQEDEWSAGETIVLESDESNSNFDVTIGSETDDDVDGNFDNDGGDVNVVWEEFDGDNQATLETGEIREGT